MSEQNTKDGIQVTKIRWNEIAKVGYPSRELRLLPSGASRTFLVRGEWSIYTAYAFDDGSGFDPGGDGQTDAPQAWAIIDGF